MDSGTTRDPGDWEGLALSHVAPAPGLAGGRAWRAWRAAALLTILSLAYGCSGRATPTFSLVGTSLVWPSPPDQPRIRYLGEIRGEASLGRRQSGMELLRSVLEGPPPLASLATPMSVAVDGLRLWVADPQHPGGPTVHVLDLEERTWAQIREAGGAALQWPIDVAVAGERVAIVDTNRAAVFVLDRTGRTTATWGSGVLSRPVAAAWKAGGELWVLDAALHAVVAFDASGREKARFGRRGGGAGEFNFPRGIWCSAAVAAGGRAFEAAVADAMNFRVQLLSGDGKWVGDFGRKGDAAGDFSLPRDVAVDSEGHIYVLDNQFENVQVFDGDGRLLMALGGGGSGPGQMSLPSGITIDAVDRIWIADTYNRRVQAFQYLRESVE